MTALLIAICIALEVSRELCFKRGREPAPRGRQSDLVPRVFVAAGILAWAVEFVLWTAVLRLAPLSVAFPLMALSYVALPLAAQVVLGERMTRMQFAGAALVAAGAGLMGIVTPA